MTKHHLRILISRICRATISGLPRPDIAVTVPLGIPYLTPAQLIRQVKRIPFMSVVSDRISAAAENSGTALRVLLILAGRPAAR